MRSNLRYLIAGTLLGTTVSLAVAQTQAAFRVPQFENAEVKVWKTVIQPGSPVSMHRHEHGRALIALKGGTVTIVKVNGPKTVHDWESGRAYWLDADPPGNELHADVNEGTAPIEVIVVELKNDKHP